MKTKNKLAWSRLVVLEPRLLYLEKLIKAVDDDGESDSFCANEYWYGFSKPQRGFKARMLTLVGWQVENEALLMSSEAYEAVYKHLYNLLPACRNCNCL